MHVLHSAQEIREWWRGSHDLTGRAVRTVAGQDAFERLPERFRTREASQGKLHESRELRAGIYEPGEFRPRTVAFVPPGLTCVYSLEVVHSTTMAAVRASSEPLVGHAVPLRDYAAEVRGDYAESTQLIASATAFGGEGLSGRVRVHDGEQDARWSDYYRDVGTRRYRGLASVRRTASRDLAEETSRVAASLRPNQQGQSELRRVTADIVCVLPDNWGVVDSLTVLTPDTRACAAIVCISVGAGRSLEELADGWHGKAIGQLSGYTPLGYEAGRVFGGRDGLRRRFRWIDACGTPIVVRALYYLELDRLYLATASTPLNGEWSRQIDVAVDRFVIV